MSARPPFFKYFCRSCRIEHKQPYCGEPPAASEMPVDCGNSYPVFPSAQVFVSPQLYAQAAYEIRDIPRCFFDSRYILVPETEAEAIELLSSKFSGQVEYGKGRQFEFVTKAEKAGFSSEILRLGHSVAGITGQTADVMIKSLELNASATLLAWAALNETRSVVH